MKLATRATAKEYLTIESLGTGYGSWENISQTYANKFRAAVNAADDAKRTILRAQFVRGYLVGNLNVTAGKADEIVFEMSRADRAAIEGGLNKDGTIGTYESSYQRATHRWSDTFGSSAANAGTKHQRAKAKAAKDTLTVPADVQALAAQLIALCATYDCDTRTLATTAVANAL